MPQEFDDTAMLILDLIHHNPGEPPFRSAFADPAHLKAYGYHGQVFKHINCVITFAALGEDLFPAGSPERAWLDPFTAGIAREIAAAKAAGLQIFYHIDLFVLPKRLVERHRERICDRHGRICIDHDFTLELHRVLLDELFARFPQVDGLVIRHGETYLHDTPFHVGNGPNPLHGQFAEAEKEHDRFVRLISFLRQEVCVKHGRTLIFRTWDYLPDKFHADPAYYLAVTDRIEPHPKLIFSIKHTRLDFFRTIMVNPAHGTGRHQQLVEVQCQREYEGKGAYPNYIARGVCTGFQENEKPLGLDDLLRNPLCAGVWTWSRGGGWFGPYLHDELWCDLNAYVIAGVAAERGDEPALFRAYARERLGLAPVDVERFRELALLSAEGVLRGRYCRAYDRHLGERLNPVDLWMRDDRLGGWEQLKGVFAKLRATDTVEEALAEKAQAVAIWERITALAEGIASGEAGFRARLALGCRYGLHLFRIVHHGWRCLALAGGAPGAPIAAERRPAVQAEVAAYRRAWADYRALAAAPACPSLYRGEYFAMPGQPAAPGLDDSVERIAAVMGG